MSLTTAEQFAAANVLTDWPDQFTYDELLTSIEDQHPDVLVWEKYEDELPADIVESIESLRINFLANVAYMTKDLCEAIKDGNQQDIADRMIALENELGV